MIFLSLFRLVRAEKLHAPIADSRQCSFEWERDSSSGTAPSMMFSDMQWVSIDLFPCLRGFARFAPQRAGYFSQKSGMLPFELGDRQLSGKD